MSALPVIVPEPGIRMHSTFQGLSIDIYIAGYVELSGYGEIGQAAKLS